MMHRGEGLYVWDVQGRRYLDATSGGVWCVNVGYGRASIADAVRDQLVELNYSAGTLGSPVVARFAEALIEKMPGMSRVYFSNSGSEANEKAYKMVRQIAHRKYAGRKHKILYRERDYHGTTITCLTSTGNRNGACSTAPSPRASSSSRIAASTAANSARSTTTAPARPAPWRRSSCARGRTPSARWCWSRSPPVAASSLRPRAT